MEGFPSFVEFRDDLFMRKFGNFRSCEQLGELVTVGRDAGSVILGDIFEFAIHIDGRFHMLGSGQCLKHGRGHFFLRRAGIDRLDSGTHL